MAGGNEGGDQAILDKNLPQGSQNMLNAEESVYYSFYSRMYEAIAPVWQSRIREVAPTQRVNAGDYSTVVDVVLDKEGNLITVKVIRQSGVPAFDEAVNTALQRTGHFPNPPKDLLNEAGEIHTGWTFTVSLQQGTGLNYLPPERNY
jgi:TonB family protein